MKTTFGIYAFCLTLVATSSAHAQAIPAELKSMFPDSDRKGKKVVKLQELTVEQRSLQTKGTKYDKSDFITVEVGLDYLDMLSSLDVERSLKLDRKGAAQSINGYSYLGDLKEGEHRRSFAFGSRSGVQAFVTEWNYAADGASIVVTEDFVNQRVDDMSGTLSLAINSSSDKCVWKLFVSNDIVSYDIMVLDTMHNGRPSIPHQRIVELAGKLIDFSKQR